ncbi:MAG: reverse transcriptase domain-containing protein [Chloroflexi bacterium]|nr:reverse transcriptase domain-containing protein [Chloroflexota bacterium]
MQTAEQILQAMHKLGEKGTPLTRVYRCLFSEDLFLAAYDKIARNRGALTAGTEADDTVDGMNLGRIQRIIEQLRTERFRFHPARRVQIPKKNGGTRSLGVPNFSDKLVQEALRLLLEAYYEPRFCDSSHGFRPGRGCHTALADLKRRFQGAAWFIEGDIRGCFDNIDHQVLMEILSRDIQDGRLLNLIRMLLEAGYMEDWHYNRTYSGTPQGGILSPLVANIYLHELDAYIEEQLVPQYSRGEKRAASYEYGHLGKMIQKAQRHGDTALIKELQQQRRWLPSQDTQDPDFRRLHYLRYADDFILGLIGPKSEAEEIKRSIGAFLKDTLHLEMSASKTLITHARTEHARFLGYDISVYHADDKLTARTGTRTKTRSINGCIRLGVPYGKVDELAVRYLRHGKPIHEANLLQYSDAEIMNVYQQRFRGIAEYYKYAVDRCALRKLKYVMEVALTKTLADKFKSTVPWAYRQYGGRRTVDGKTYKVLVVEVPTKDDTHYIYWGGIPLKVVKPGSEPIDDDIRRRHVPLSSRTDLIQRLQANECEICGSTDRCEVHHVRKMADLKNRWRGRKDKPAWVVRMIALQRKTLVVCKSCHDAIHAGKPLPDKCT